MISSKSRFSAPVSRRKVGVGDESPSLVRIPMSIKITMVSPMKTNPCQDVFSELAVSFTSDMKYVLLCPSCAHLFSDDGHLAVLERERDRLQTLCRERVVDSVFHTVLNPLLREDDLHHAA